MKYLKVYEIFFNDGYFDSPSYIEKRKTIREICYDLTDYGYEVDPSGFFSGNTGEKYSEITISKRINYERIKFTFNQHKDTFLRIIDYLGEDFIHIELIPCHPDKNILCSSSKDIHKMSEEIEGKSYIMNIPLIKIVIRYI